MLFLYTRTSGPERLMTCPKPHSNESTNPLCYTDATCGSRKVMLPFTLHCNLATELHFRRCWQAWDRPRWAGSRVSMQRTCSLESEKPGFKSRLYHPTVMTLQVTLPLQTSLFPSVKWGQHCLLCRMKWNIPGKAPTSYCGFNLHFSND